MPLNRLLFNGSFCTHERLKLWTVCCSPPRPILLSMHGCMYFHIANLKANVDATSMLHTRTNPKRKCVHAAGERGSCPTSTGLFKLVITVNKKTRFTSWRTISSSLLWTSASDMQVPILGSQRGDTPELKSPTDCPQRKRENKRW